MQYGNAGHDRTVSRAGARPARYDETGPDYYRNGRRYVGARGELGTRSLWCTAPRRRPVSWWLVAFLTTLYIVSGVLVAVSDPA